MCGIAGLLDHRGLGASSLELVRAMTAMLHHRGPDESGVYVDDFAALGHARLSIIDLAGGTQPVRNEDGRFWIIYNGEVFNYVELREELEANGHRFYTASDTEVVIHLFEEMGAECLERMNGQFAFAIWDAREKELTLARDRVGIRPLFYTTHGGVFRFASEIKAIFADPEVPREIDPVALGQVFMFWSTLSGATAFKDIHEVPPGHYMTLSTGGIDIRRYWSVPFASPDEQIDWPFEDIKEKIAELLADSVRIRLRADVPVGCYLSGGLDSSAIAALVARDADQNVRTFGIRFEDREFDEGEHQAAMVSFLGTDHTEMEVTDGLIGANLPSVLWHCETPLLRTAPVPLFLLSKVVRESGFKVVLTGEGSDEIFGGYNIFRETKARRFLARRPDSELRRGLLAGLYPYVFSGDRTRRAQRMFFSAGLEEIDDPLFSHLLRWRNTGGIRRLLSPEIRAELASHDDKELIRRSLPDGFECLDYLAKAQYLEMSIFLSNYLLPSQGDRVAMANSVEIRIPFLDFRLIEFMARVPAKWKILGLKEKYALKRAVAGYLPRSVVKRAKHPYRAPIARSLLFGEAGEVARDMLSRSAVRRAGFFDPEGVAALLRKCEIPGRTSERDNMALMGVLSTQLLNRIFVTDFQRGQGDTHAESLIVDRRSTRA